MRTINANFFLHQKLKQTGFESTVICLSSWVTGKLSCLTLKLHLQSSGCGKGEC